jgi:hypothetical protein
MRALTRPEPRYHVVMEINAIGSVLVDLFEVGAVLGLALLAVVIGVLAHAVLDEHRRDGFRSHVGSDR